MPRASKAPKAPIPLEHDIQANFFREVGYEFRNDSTFESKLLYAVLHGAWIAGSGRRKQGLIAKYKREGWKPGIPDVHYDQPRGPYNKLVLEFKRADRRGEDNGGLSDEQLEYMNAAAPYAMVRVVYSEEEAIQTFSKYMELPIRESESLFDELLKFHRQFNHNQEECEICLGRAKMMENNGLFKLINLD